MSDSKMSKYKRKQRNARAFKKSAAAGAAAGAVMLAAAARRRLSKRRRRPKGGVERKFGNDCFESKEMVTDLKSSTAYSVISFDINPTDPILFPRLSRIAQLYQEWKCDYIKFHFESTSSNALTGTNTALGKYVMAVQYNPDAPVFPSMAAALTDTKSKISKPASSSTYNFDFSAAYVGKDGRMFIEYNGITSPKTTWSLGTLNFCTEGSQAAATIGTLWVSYRIRFFKPTVVSSFIGATASRYGSVAAGGRPCPTDMSIIDNSLPLVIQNNGSTTTGSDILFPRTPTIDYYILSYAVGSAANGGNGNLVYSAGVGVQISSTYMGDIGYFPRSAGATYDYTMVTMLVKIPQDVSNGVTIRFSAASDAAMDANLFAVGVPTTYAIYFPTALSLSLPLRRPAVVEAPAAVPASAEAKEEA